MKSFAAVWKTSLVLLRGAGLLLTCAADLNGQDVGSDLSGSWSGMYELNESTYRGLTFELDVVDDVVSGSYQIENGNHGTIEGVISEDGTISLGFVHSDTDCEGELSYVGRLETPGLMSFEVSGWDCSGSGAGGGYATRNRVNANVFINWGIAYDAQDVSSGNVYVMINYDGVSAARVVTPSGYREALEFANDGNRWSKSFFYTPDAQEERFPDGIYAYEIELGDGSVVYDINALGGALPSERPVVLTPGDGEFVSLGDDLLVSWEAAPEDVTGIRLSTYFEGDEVMPALDATEYSYDGASVVADEDGDLTLRFMIYDLDLRCEKSLWTYVDINTTGDRMPAVEGYIMQGDYETSGTQLIFTVQFHGAADVSSAEIETPGGEVIAFDYLESPEELAFGDGSANWVVIEVDDLETGMTRFPAGDYEVRVTFDDSTIMSSVLSHAGVYPSNAAVISVPASGAVIEDSDEDTVALQWESIPENAQARVVIVNPLKTNTIPEAAVIQGVERSIVSDFIMFNEEADSGSYDMAINELRWDRAYQMQVIYLRASGDFYACMGAKPVFFKTPKSEYQLWQADLFSEEELENEALSGMDADPDMDGLSNLEEYVFDLNPKQAGVGSPLSMVFETLEDAKTLMVEITMNPDIDEDAVVLEMSYDCVHWFPVLSYPDVFQSTEAGVRRMESSFDRHVFYRLALDTEEVE